MGEKLGKRKPLREGEKGREEKKGERIKRRWKRKGEHSRRRRARKTGGPCGQHRQTHGNEEEKKDVKKNIYINGLTDLNVHKRIEHWVVSSSNLTFVHNTRAAQLFLCSGDFFVFYLVCPQHLALLIRYRVHHVLLDKIYYLFFSHEEKDDSTIYITKIYKVKCWYLSTQLFLLSPTTSEKNRCVLISGNAVPYTTPITLTFEETSLKGEGNNSTRKQNETK